MSSWVLALLALGLCLGIALARQYSVTPMGCFIDGVNGVKDLIGLKDLGYRMISNPGKNGITKASESNNSMSIGSDAMSNEFCGSICSAGGFRFMGLQSGWWCFCGNSYGSQGAAPLAECSSTCAANTAQNCGGPSRNYVLQLSYTYDRTRFVHGSRTLMDVARADALTLRVDRMAECVYLCYLLGFAAVPDDLKSADSGDFYVWA